MNTCTRCTKELLTGANYCPICGEAIQSDEEAATVETEAAVSGFVPGSLHKGIVDRESAFIFIQKHQHYYFDRWRQGESWNWAAFFFISLWLGYRKMYRYLLMLIGFWIVYDALIMMMFSYMPIWSSILAFLVPAAYLGAKGNDLYKSHLNREIVRINRHNLNREVRLKCIEKAGGTAKIGIFYALLLAISYLIFFNYS